MRIKRSADCGNSPKNKRAEEIAIEHVQQTFAKIRQLAIETVVTHGRAGAVDGELELASGKTQRFCIVVRFVTAKADKVESIRVYTATGPSTRPQ